MNQFLDIFGVYIEYRARAKTKKAGAEAALEVPTGEKAVTRTPKSHGSGSLQGYFFSVWPCLHFRDYWIGYVLGWCLFVCLKWPQSGRHNGCSLRPENSRLQDVVWSG